MQHTDFLTSELGQASNRNASSCQTYFCELFLMDFQRMHAFIAHIPTLLFASLTHTHAHIHPQTHLHIRIYTQSSLSAILVFSTVSSNHVSSPYSGDIEVPTRDLSMASILSNPHGV